TLGGGAKLDDKGNLVGPSYTVDGKPVNNIGDAISNIDGRTADNSKGLSELSNSVAAGKAGLVQLDDGGNAVFSKTLGTDKAFNVGGRTISGVKAAALNAASADAVNGSQLFATNNTLANTLGGGAKLDDKGNLVGPSYTVDGKPVNNIGDAISNIDGRTADNSKGLSELSNSVAAGKAGLVQLDDGGNAVFSKTLGTDKAFNVGGRTISGVKAAALNAASADAVNGSQLFATNQRLDATVNNINENKIFKVSNDGERVIIAERAEKVKSLDIGGRKIEGVKNGTISATSKDAVNGYQLNESNKKIAGNSRRITTVENKVERIEGRIGKAEKKIENNRKRASAGIAGAMALASIPYVYSEDVSFGMGAAAYDDQGAISAGLNFRTSNSSAVRINYSLDTQNSMGMGVGFAVGF
ncbi:YadA-like family protein, partial [Serratia ureilytica]